MVQCRLCILLNETDKYFLYSPDPPNLLNGTNKYFLFISPDPPYLFYLTKTMSFAECILFFNLARSIIRTRVSVLLKIIADNFQKKSVIFVRTTVPVFKQNINKVMTKPCYKWKENVNNLKIIFFTYNLR